jgi:AcrR family transcriptional regulator
MPQKSQRTKAQLVRAGAQLFARDGVNAALTRDIVASAGQANDSAIHYHFGSRGGLLEAILTVHIDRMEAARRDDVATLSERSRLSTLVRVIVEPLAIELRSDDGRDFLRIIAQLSAEASGDASRLPIVRGTALAQELALLERRLAASLPRALVRERVAMMITMLTAALADRARRIDSGRRMSIGHDAYVANLVAMLTGALRAPTTR